MSETNDAIEAMKAAAPDAAVMRNTIRSPLTGTPDDENWQAVFNGNIPPKIMFYSYGAKFTVRAELTVNGQKQGYMHPFTPNDYDVLDIPPGTTAMNASVSNVSIEKPDTASVLVTF